MIRSGIKSLQKRLRHFILTHPYAEDVALPFLLLLLILTALPTLPGSEFGFRELDIVGYLLILLQLLGLLFLRRSPLIAYAALQIGFQGYNALNYAHIDAMFFALLVGTYIVALHTIGWRNLIALSLTLAGLTFFFYTTAQTYFTGNILNAYVQWVAVWLLGTLHRLYRERKQAEAASAQRAKTEAVIEERNRLARELHDSVTQSLHGSILMTEAAQRLAEAGDLKRTQGYLARLGEISQQALKEMRLLVYELRPLALEDVTLIEAIQQRLDVVERRAGVEVQLLADDHLDLPDPIEEALYRIAQEALNNALQHASPTAVLVSVQVTGEPPEQQVILEVSDDGAGFDMRPLGDQGGIGLSSMKERAENLGGNLTINSSPGEGTQVKATIGFQSTTDSK